jgi:hypothetical protein
MSICKDPPSEQLSHSTVTFNENNIDSETAVSPVFRVGFWCRFMAEVDTNHTTIPLAAFSFMTGFMYAFLSHQPRMNCELA